MCDEYEGLVGCRRGGQSPVQLLHQLVEGEGPLVDLGRVLVKLCTTRHNTHM